MQGTIVKRQKIRSNGKVLEYFLLGPDEMGEYSIAAMSHKDEQHRDRFAIVQNLTEQNEIALHLFDLVVCGTVRPETLGETLYDLDT